MNIPDTMLVIETLGLFRLSVAGKTVVTEWPDESLKLLFCSLLSPLDLYFTWDRICRSTWDVPATNTTRHRLDEHLIRPLNALLIREFGFTPLVSGPEGVRVNHDRIHVDAMDFYRTVLDGLRLMSIDDHPAALEALHRAGRLYTGNYLPGFTGKIITNTRTELESLYRTAVLDAGPIVRTFSYAGYVAHKGG
ncbi:MAG: hypothetical protein A2076_08820 [Geobacteraceae bacterium GWC2_53_11]|nr:MAG: hypothetical protein A2076_08820 [Geobacteraceae bacterium GWC2_53_11]